MKLNGIIYHQRDENVITKVKENFMTASGILWKKRNNRG